MKKSIQNIFMDLKSYELIQDAIPLNELIPFILDNVNPAALKPISICGHLFEVEFLPRKHPFTFIFTPRKNHIIDPYENRFKNNVYLYNHDAVQSYEEPSCRSEVLIYTMISSIGGYPL